jgi:hypothetical protein
MIDYKEYDHDDESEELHIEEMPNDFDNEYLMDITKQFIVEHDDFYNGTCYSKKITNAGRFIFMVVESVSRPYKIHDIGYRAVIIDMDNKNMINDSNIHNIDRGICKVSNLRQYHNELKYLKLVNFQGTIVINNWKRLQEIIDLHFSTESITVARHYAGDDITRKLRDDVICQLNDLVNQGNDISIIGELRLSSYSKPFSLLTRSDIENNAIDLIPSELQYHVDVLDVPSKNVRVDFTNVKK